MSRHSKSTTTSRQRRRPERAHSRSWARISGVAVLALAGLLATQCSSDSSTKASSTTTERPAPSGGDKATGSPVKIGLINAEGGQAVSVPEIREGAQAAIKYANDELGGIDGHKIDLVVCKTAGTPESSRGCANQMVDAGVNALVIGNDGSTDQIVPIITGAGIPYIGASAGGPAEATTAGAFSLTAGSPGNYGAMAMYAKDQGWKKISVLVINVAAALGTIKSFAEKAFTASGVRLTSFPMAPGAPDVSPQLTQALSGADAVLVIANDSLCIAAMKAYAAVNAKVPLVLGSNTCLGKSVEAASPPAVYKGASVITSQFVGDDDDESNLYLRVMKTYSPGTDVGGIAQRGYAAALGLVRAVHDVHGTIDPASLLAGIEAARDVPLPLGAGLTFSCDGKAVAGLVSVCSSGAVIAEVLGGGRLKLIAKKDPSALLG